MRPSCRTRRKCLSQLARCVGQSMGERAPFAGQPDRAARLPLTARAALVAFRASSHRCLPRLLSLPAFLSHRPCCSRRLPHLLSLPIAPSLPRPSPPFLAHPLPSILPNSVPSTVNTSACSLRGAASTPNWRRARAKWVSSAHPGGQRPHLSIAHPGGQRPHLKRAHPAGPG